jgi:hypothetical protein
MIIYYQSDNILKLTGLKNLATGAYINNATVNVTLTRDGGEQVAGQSWPTPLAYVNGSNGEYSCALTRTLVLTPPERIIATITADAGTNLYKTWQIRLVVRVDSNQSI